jgi:hypothetical protein
VPVQEPTMIAILGGNAVMGRALALLLRGVGYDAEYIKVCTPLPPWKKR